MTEYIDSRLREIDAVFSLGGLQHSRRRRPAIPITAGLKPVSGGSKTTRNVLSKRRTNTGRSKPVVLRVPEWNQYCWLAHGFSTRVGGVSTVYRPDTKCGELNLGLTASDTRGNVEKNRELFLRAVLADDHTTDSKPKPIQLVLLRQVHSGLVYDFPRRNSSARMHSQAEMLLRGDGSIATEPGMMLGIQTADCLPILVADVRQRIVAAFHAGWRGTLARIAERGVGRMRAEFGSQPGDLTAAIGPGIGRCCYSVGEEVRMEFSSQFVYADALFEEVFDLDPIKQKYPMLFLTARAPGHSNLGPSIHLDLAEANRRQLLDAGLNPEAIHSMSLCTACDTKHFFSHRAEQGFTGRMLSTIGIRSE